MYSIVYIILMIASYQLKAECTQQFTAENVPSYALQSPDTQNCYLKMPKDNYTEMPITFAVNTSNPYILRPDIKGHFRINHNQTFGLSCAGTYFVSPTRSSVRELMVTCYNGFIYYKLRPFLFNDFRCFKTPLSVLKVTERSCQGSIDNKVMLVGFATTYGLLYLYSICFDLEDSNVLYSWFSLKPPIYSIRQTSDKPIKFNRTPNFGKANVVVAYRNQSYLVGKVVHSKHLASRYIRMYEKRYFLTPCLLSGHNIFYYLFEQHATYYYENTLPQWIESKKFAWKELDKVFRENLIKYKQEFLVITGSYMTSTLLDENSDPQPFYLRLPDKFAVPQYIWKMLYNYRSREGIVYIGLNNPFKDLDDTVYFCEQMKCPGLVERTMTENDLIFCCSKKSFEKVYGKIDPVVYERNTP